MINISIRDMVDYDLAGMAGEIAVVLGVKLYELPTEQRRAIDRIGFKYAGRVVDIVTDHI